MIITGKKFSKPTMSRVINGDLILPEAPVGPTKIRLDHQLVKNFPIYQRAALQSFIKQGRVTVDGQVVTKPSAMITLEQIIELTPSSPTTHPMPPILYQDSDVIVFDKPAGLLSMKKTSHSNEPSLEDFGLLVHRLDRDTSGVVILAKHPAAQAFLRRQFQERTTKKTYYAIVSGQPKLSQALIDLPIARNLKRPTTFQVDPQGKPAQTTYRILQSTSKLSLLELQPATGRTHQLRVHLRHLGTPILGDRVYSFHPELAKRQSRLFLHASSLEITLPSQVRHLFKSPLPTEFQDVLR